MIVMHALFRRRVVAIAVALAASASCHAQPVQNAQWAWAAGKQSNDGSITIKSLKTPGASSAAAKNPTGQPGGSVVDLRQNAATQPPVLLLKVEGFDPWSLYFKDRKGGL